MFKGNNVPLKLGVKVETGKILAGSGALALFKALREKHPSPEREVPKYVTKHK